MKRSAILCFFLVLCCFGCGLGDREKELKQKEEAISKKQQELMLWEQRLTIKEKDLDTRKQLLDSNKIIDTVMAHDANLPGKWLVKMQCIETSCDGSAIGDTKTEQWEVTSTNNNVVAKAYTGKQLSRIYNGQYKQNGMVLTDQLSTTESLIRITLRPTANDVLEGTREIIQENCKIVYSLVAKRIP
jgi:hypothetical protein